MIPASKFRTQLIIASAFIAGDELKLTNAFIQALQEWSTIYDGDPISLPSSQLTPPPEFPTAILQSRDQSLGIEMARTKINLYWKRSESDKDASIDISDIYSQFADRIATIAEKNKAVIGRLAALRMSMENEPTPGRVLSKQFCREEILNGPLKQVEGFELHAHKVLELYQAQNVNSWVRIKTSGSPGPDYEHIIVEQDINTLAEEINSRNFDRANIMRFFDRASGQLDSILNEYFPGKTEELRHD